MDEAAKKAARIEIRKRRDALLIERAHFWWVRYFAEKRMEWKLKKNFPKQKLQPPFLI